MVKRPTSSNNDDDNENEGTGGWRRMPIDPLVKALLGHLPSPKSVWPLQERQKWLNLLGEALGVIYRDAEPMKPGQPGDPTIQKQATQHPPGAVSPPR